MTERLILRPCLLKNEIPACWQDDDTLSDKLQLLARRHATLAVANGCFDVCHPGHVRMLTYVRQCCWLQTTEMYLFVLVNNDASVCAIKGSGRPVLSFAHRAAVVKAIDGVDYVLGFGETSPEELIQVLQPTILLKGSSRRTEIVPGEDFVMSKNGLVLVVPELVGWSTTKIVDGIRKTMKS